MPKLPIVAIIGRPNTGKSTLFNCMIRERVAIENEVAGTTRDHVSHVVKTEKVDFLLVDTGGMGGGTDDKEFEDDVHKQSMLALQSADLILFTVDGRVDPTKSDYEIAQILRRQRRRHVPVILVITKCDNSKMEEQARHNFHELGAGDEVITVSAAHRLGTDGLEQAIAARLVELHFEKSKAEITVENSLALPRIAIIGKPNVGKSSIINALMSETQRSISPKLVSDIPGTTRDSTDTLIRYQEKEYLFVDTAGLRRQTKVEKGVESISMMRSMQSIEDCDIALLVLDGKEPVSKQDKRIASLVIDAGKGLIIVMNKTDVMTKEDKEARKLDIKRNFQFCRFAPVLPVSAVSREGLLKIFDLTTMVQQNRLRRISEKDLKQFFEDAVRGKPMSSLWSTKFMTQAKDPPPTFVLFVKNPKHVRLSQLRYIDNRLRETFGLEGTPVRWITKGPRDRREK
jgi:GTP-binding protein